MIEINPTRWKVRPFAHQVEDVKSIVRRPAFALFNEMGSGKSKSAIDGACELFANGLIDTVVIICPAGVKNVWLNRELGQIVRYAWVPSLVVDFRNRTKNLNVTTNLAKLTWVVASYEFIRERVHEKTLIAFLKTRSTLLVLDESWCIKNHKAAQTQACFKLGEAAARRLLLNGTPIANTPMDLYAQFAFLDENIIGCQNYYHFRARYAKMGGFNMKSVVGFHDLDDLNRRTAPYLRRVLKRDCLDLPEKVGGIESETPNFIEVSLSAEAWRIYCEMKRDMIAYLGDRCAIAKVAAVKGLRLAQITAGFIGGLVETLSEDEQDFELVPDNVELPQLPLTIGPILREPPREIGREKLDAIFGWLNERQIQRALIWCRFRPELERFYDLAREDERFAGYKFHKIYGAQSRTERQAAEREGEMGTGPCLTFGQPQAGGMGLTLVSFDTEIYASNTHSLKDRQQSEDRLHRPGQRNVVTILDVLATGPMGQKTANHLVLKALRKKENLASWTTQQWLAALRELDEEDVV